MTRILLVVAALLALGCGDDGRGGDDDDSGTDTETSTDPPAEWCDETTGLCWQLEAISADWYEAMDACGPLVLAGHDDWRLPNIDELRSLLRGCPETVTGGECLVTDGSAYDDIDFSFCNGCDAYSGPEQSYGCYWDDGMGGECGDDSDICWSSSEDTQWEPSDDAWHASFSDASVFSSPKDTIIHVRCVRDSE